MALPEKLTLEVVTPERKVLSETVDAVVLPGREGYLGILPGHTPLLTSLTIGEVQYTQGREVHLISLAWGFAEVLPGRVTILTEVAERGDEIDLARAKAKKEEMERLLKNAGQDFDFDKAQASLLKAIIRIDVAMRTLRRLPGEPERRAPRADRIKSEGPGD